MGIRRVKFGCKERQKSELYVSLSPNFIRHTKKHNVYSRQTSAELAQYTVPHFFVFWLIGWYFINSWMHIFGTQ